MTLKDPLSKLKKQYPGREQQLDIIDKLIGKETYLSPSLIYIYGNTSSGKSEVILNYLKIYYNHYYAFLNLIECYNANSVMQRILDTFYQKKKENVKLKGNKVEMFLDTLKNLAIELEDQKLVIVLDKAERLRQFEINFWLLISRLSEITGLNITTILISNIPFSQIRPSSGIREPFILRFPEYTKENIKDIILSKKDNFYSNKLSLKMNTFLLSELSIILYDVIYKDCKDLRDILHLIKILYPVFIQPVIDSDNADNIQIISLYSEFKPYFNKVCNQFFNQTNVTSIPIDPTITSKSINEETLLRLPQYSLYLIIASYLASYNPSKTDMNYFYRGMMKRQRKKRTNVIKVTKASTIPQELLGPKAFPFERLQAIFQTLIEQPNILIYSLDTMVASLISLGILSSVGGYGKLDLVKLKCNLTYDQLIPIADHLAFPLNDYLYREA